MIDIVAICWNYEHFLDQFIKSLQDQTYKNFRVLFYDNCSTDSSLTKAKYLLEKTGIEHIIITRDRPHGVSSNLNYVINNYVTSDWFMLISVDDWFGPLAIENRVNHRAKLKNVNVLLSNPVIYYDDTDTYEYIAFDYTKTEEPVLEKLVLGNLFSAPGGFFKLSFFNEMDGFDEALSFEDWDMWIRIYKNGHSVEVIDDKMVFYRRHRKSITAAKDIQYYFAIKQTLDKHKDVATYKKAVQIIKYNTLFYPMNMANHLKINERFYYLRKLAYWHSNYFLQVARFFYQLIFNRKGTKALG